MILSLVMGLLSLLASSALFAAGAAAQATSAIFVAEASMDGDDEEDDEEDEAVDYRDRVHQIQEWMHRRGAERKQSQGTDAAPPNLSDPYPKYFQDKGYDESGYRRVPRDVRIRFRDAPRVYSRHSHRRHFSGHRHSSRRHGRHYQWRSSRQSHHYSHGRSGSRHHSSYPPRRAGRYSRPRVHHPSDRSGRHIGKVAPGHHAAKTRTGHSKSGKKGRSRH